jgi:hypothetical protein
MSTGHYDRLAALPSVNLHETLARLAAADDEARQATQEAIAAMEHLRSSERLDGPVLGEYETAMGDYAEARERVGFDLGFTLGLAAREAGQQDELAAAVVTTLAGVSEGQAVRALAAALLALTKSSRG